MSEVTNNAPFLLIQKPQELIKLFEGLIGRKIREMGVQAPPLASLADESPSFPPKMFKRFLTSAARR
ncbi:hypothetical protein [Niastella populi]|uniref:Uncharacterized protein n=1 Tax=Niastella populi TaxID=550983 RepID=A0A1V9EGW9_9BACT|nr:hypothetical protein [Niastella populi]OQP45302.1 hypothetical protein A4R26_32330 [Niastella populi]